MTKYIFCIALTIVIFFSGCEKKEENKEKELTGEVIADVSFSGEKINSSLVDKSGRLWFGTNEGLFSFDGAEWVKYTTGLPGQKINGLTLNDENKEKLYVCTNNGVSAINLDGDVLKIGETVSTETGDIKSDTVYVMKIDDYGNKWYGTHRGVSMDNGETWINEFVFGLGEYIITSIALRGNDYFFATDGYSLRHGYYSPDVDGITQASEMMTPFNGNLTTRTIYCLLIDSDTLLWFGSTDGLTKNYGDTRVLTGHFDYYLIGESVHSVFKSSENKIFAGKETGLSVYDGTDWVDYSTENGLAGNIVYTICEDEDGNIWIGTDNGISSFDGNTFVNY